MDERKDETVRYATFDALLMKCTDDLAHVSQEQNRYLSLSGVAMSQDYARDHAAPAMSASLLLRCYYSERIPTARCCRWYDC